MRRNPLECGQALVVVALGMVILLGFLGLGFDLGFLRYQKRQAQKTADAVAVASALMLSSCTAGASCGAMNSAASSAFTENVSGVTPMVVTQAGGSCGGTLGSSYPVIAVNSPPCYLGSPDPNHNNPQVVEVVMAESVPLAFSTVFGKSTYVMTVRSEAALSGGSNVLYALNQTYTDTIMLMLGIVSSNGGVVDESNNRTAFGCFIGDFSAPYIGVVGGDGFPLCLFPQASPQTGIATPTPADPLAYLQSDLQAQAPSYKVCGSGSGSTWYGSASQLTLSSTATLNSGTYCGGIVINPGANVTFEPGIYTLTSYVSGGKTYGGLQVNAGTNVTANEVGIYNYGPSGGINFVCPSCTAGNVTFTAQNTSCSTGCEPAWQGILFYQDPGDTSASIIVGSSAFNVDIKGTSYLPSANVTYALDFAVNYNILVANTVTFGVQWGETTVNTNFYNNFSELANGNPIRGQSANLVE